jgi:hypothetical protein
MAPDQWLSLGLSRDMQETFEAGGLHTVEAAGVQVVGVPRRGDGHVVLGEASSREEAVVIATILRMFNPR